MQKKIEVIDFLKGYSMLSIVIYHIGQQLNLPGAVARMINFGGTGVHTFIFVSGFGLYLSHLRRPLPFVAFLRKRFSKIYVPYVITVTVSAAIALFLPIYPTSAFAYFGHVLLYKMFFADIMGSYGYQLWFMSTIIQLYFLFIPLTRLKERMGDAAFLMMGLAVSISWGVLIVATGHESMRNYNGAFFLYLWEFMLGMILAGKFVREGYAFWEMKIIWLVLLSVAGIACYGLMALELGAYGRLLNDVPALVGYTGLSILLYRLRISWVNRFLLYTATFSYALFLVHILVLQLVLLMLSRLGIPFSWGMGLGTLALCLFAGYWADKFFEWTDRLLFRRAARPAAAAGG
ncbi:MAG TPA: acyltransferase [Puia sp.]|jgi:peptidoglycan/LPS O-acetylase OafA/YrhL|nr:acyltransferase [Puia sp.]